MADNKISSEDMGNYAAKHPRRVASGMFIAGTVLGASLMAAKKSHDKNALQKFMDQISK